MAPDAGKAGREPSRPQALLACPFVISPAAIKAVTNPSNMAAHGEDLLGAQAVRSEAVVEELRRLEGLGADEARRLGRDAVAHVGGQIEIQIRRSRLAAGRGRKRRNEVWWVPRSAIRS